MKLLTEDFSPIPRITVQTHLKVAAVVNFGAEWSQVAV